MIELQLADAKDVLEGIQNVKGARFPVLTPNLKVSCSHFRNRYKYSSRNL